MFCRSAVSLGALRLCRPLHNQNSKKKRRFVTPWEKEGKTAADFFGNIYTDKNPILRRKRQQERERTMWEEQENANTETLEEERRMQYIQTQNDIFEKQTKHFLPYAATPKGFNAGDCAVWGEYKANILLFQKQNEHHHNRQKGPLDSQREKRFSSEVEGVLMKNDFQSKIPYRYDENFSIEEFYRTNKKIKFPFYNKVGLVIDVNGTLLRGTEIVDESDVAIQKLNQLRIPFVLLCNHYMFVLELEAKLASSMTQTVFNTLEEKTAHLLSLLLRTTILADQIIFPFAPMKLLAEYYKGKNVLVVGNQRHKGFLPNRGDDSSSPLIKDILYQLGFTNVVSCLDYQCRHPELTPYKFYDQHMATSGGTSAPFEPISAIIQLSEPDDALNDAQTVLDVLLSVQNNPPGSPYNTVNHTVVVNEQLIPFYTVHDDVFTAHTFVLPRLSLEGGVFRNFIANLYNNITGNKLSCTTYGKPRHVLLAYAQARLEHLVTNGVFHTPGNQEGAMEHIFMVGDSIESDVVGANAMSYIQEEEGGPPASRVQWRSVYVMTGVGNNNFNTNDAQAVDSNVFTNYQYKYKEENKDDSELHFLDTHHNALSIPHYISPSFDHFLREFFAFPPEVFLEEKKKEDRGNHVPTLTLDLRSIYGWGSAP